MGDFFKLQQIISVCLMKRAAPELWKCIETVVAGLGYNFVGARCGHERGDLLLRVFIDKAEGVTVDDCGVVSQQLGAVLDVENLLSSAYVLEVSSPGVERPLFEAKDFARFCGEKVFVKLLIPQQGQRRFRGHLKQCENGVITIEADGKSHLIALSSIDNAHILPSV